MPPGRLVPSTSRRAYRFDRLSSLLAGLYMGSIFPFAGVIAREQLHASPAILGLMTAAPFIGNLLALFWAQAMEGRPKLPFVKWSHFAARLTFLLAPFAVTPLRFALIIAGAQILGSLASPAYAAVIKEVYPDDQRGRIMSYTRATLFTASVLTTFAIGPLLKVVSYQYVFPVMCLFGLAAALIFGRIPVPSEAEAAGERGPRRTLTEAIGETVHFLLSTLRIFHTDHGYRWFALSVFTYGFGNLMLAPAIPLIQVDRLHISTTHIALLANLAQVTAAVSYFFWGRYVDRHSPIKAVILNILLNALIPIFYLLAWDKWMLVPAFILSGVTQAGIDLWYFNSILSFAREENASRYQALHSFLLGIRGILAPLLGAYLIGALPKIGDQPDLSWLFGIALTLILVGCWMQLIGAAPPPLGTGHTGSFLVRILITNDDGVHAEGLLVLKKALDPLAEVTVLAPDRPRSACGHSITLHKPLRLSQTTLADGSAAWTSSGTPSDCVTLALLEVMRDRKPDLVVSGINDGPNLGWDLTYSGTVSAAMEGAISGLQAIAISVAWRLERVIKEEEDDGPRPPTDFTVAARFAVRLTRTAARPPPPAPHPAERQRPAGPAAGGRGHSTGHPALSWAGRVPPRPDGPPLLLAGRRLARGHPGGRHRRARGGQRSDLRYPHPARSHRLPGVETDCGVGSFLVSGKLGPLGRSSISSSDG